RSIPAGPPGGPAGHRRAFLPAARSSAAAPGPVYHRGRVRIGGPTRPRRFADAMMRALRKTEPGPGLRMVDLPEPSTGSLDVKIRVLRAGICGTDLHILAWDSSAEAMCDIVPF